MDTYYLFLNYYNYYKLVVNNCSSFLLPKNDYMKLQKTCGNYHDARITFKFVEMQIDPHQKVIKTAVSLILIIN